jgi:hypothetical protein
MKIVNIQCWGMEYSNYILIEDAEDLNEYHSTILEKETADAIKELFEYYCKYRQMGHMTNRLADTANFFAKLKGRGPLYELDNLVGKVTMDQIKLIINNKPFAVNFNGGYFPLPKDYKISKIPEFIYTESDIHISKFEGGRHFYAKVGKLEVTDRWGERKWNTYNYAYEQAKNFLEKLKISSMV